MNRDELSQLYCEWSQQLFTCALVITRSPERAEDAVHDSFCRLLPSKTKPAQLKAYVFRAVRNAALDQVRRKGTTEEPLPEFVFDPHPQPTQLAEASDFQQQVVDSIKSLTADQRETIVQHLYGELTFREIAAVREVPLGTVTSWYRRGLEKLRQQLEVPDGSV